MNEARLQAWLDHMEHAASDACQFLEGMDKTAFLADKRTQQAVIMSLVIIGEAATNIIERYAPYTAKHSEVPWRSMWGMRNRLAHGYFEIDLEVVWETVQTALPAFLKIVPSLREDTDPGPSIPSRADSR